MESVGAPCLLGALPLCRYGAMCRHAKNQKHCAMYSHPAIGPRPSHARPLSAAGLMISSDRLASCVPCHSHPAEVSEQKNDSCCSGGSTALITVNKVPCRYGGECRLVHDASHFAKYDHPAELLQKIWGGSDLSQLRPCKYGSDCRLIVDPQHREQYMHPGQDEDVSQEGDHHVGIKYPRIPCRDHPGCQKRRTCWYSHGLIHATSQGTTAKSGKATCFLGQAPHNQCCTNPTWNGEPFEFCSKACKEIAKKTPKGPLGCRRENCPCPCTINGLAGQFCCEACSKGRPCASAVHLVPTAHLSLVAAPQLDKYAPCARAGCACAVRGGSSWNGAEGQFCCRACRNGTPCTKLWHTVPQSVAIANAEARYVGHECALDGCSEAPFNGRAGGYCCKEHRREGEFRKHSTLAAKALQVPVGTFPDYVSLYVSAQTWLRRNGVGALKGRITAVWLNESLASPTCPARISFERAIARSKLRRWDDGEFGWHGTTSISALESICWANWDTQRRSGQANGPGEYFSRGTAEGLHYSEGYAGGDAANLLIVAWIISSSLGASPQDPSQNGACRSRARGHIVCRNPVHAGNQSTGEMHCIPIAVVAFGKADKKPTFRTA